MSLSLWVAFVAASALLMLVPGPNVALIVANSLRFGPRHGLLAVTGTTLAGGVQLGLTVVGLAALIAKLGTGFAAVRWLGALYLIALGIRQWRAAPESVAAREPGPGSRRAVLAQALLVSLTNPKTLLFFGAFLPQFMIPDAPAGPQLAVLSLTYLGVAAAIDGGWALLAVRARGLLTSRARLRNRFSGGMLIGAGVGLSLIRA